MDYLIQNATFATNIELLGILFVGGLIGSLAHCVAMCGPFMACLVSSERCSASTACQRKSPKHLLLITYHTGRMLTYMLLGLGVGYLGQMLFPFGEQNLPAFFLILAGLIFVFAALPQRMASRSMVSPIIAKLAAPFRQASSLSHTFILGGILGLMPCGFLYAALMASAATGSASMSAIAMGAFALGTIPALTVLGASYQWVVKRWPNKFHLLTRGLMAFNGISLFTIAGGIIT